MHFIEPGICEILREQCIMFAYTVVLYTKFVLVGYAIFCKTAIILTNGRQVNDVWRFSLLTDLICNMATYYAPVCREVSKYRAFILRITGDTLMR